MAAVPVVGGSVMPAPNQIDRVDLDNFIQLLAQAGGGLTIEDFREQAVIRARRSEKTVRRLLYLFGGGFMLALVLAFAFPEWFAGSTFRWVLIWTLCLGGLGSVSSLMLHILKLAPQ